MAIKGCSKQMIVLNGTGGSAFEAAYFIVKSDTGGRARSHGDLLREANRIVEENTFTAGRTRFGTAARERILLFSAGALCGAMLVGLVWLFAALAG